MFSVWRARQGMTVTGIDLFRRPSRWGARWLAPGGDYVLGHWGKLHPLDWRPIGPRRRSARTIERTFAPELRLRDTEVTDFATPLPFGPTVRGVGYWFRRDA